MRAALTIGALCALAAASPLAHAQGDGGQDQTYQRVEVPPGKLTRIATLLGLKPDCSAGPSPEFRVVKTPAHGKLIARRDRVRTGPKHRCPNVETTALMFSYQSGSSYEGTDEIAVEIIKPDGRKSTAHAQIEVRRAAEKPVDL